MIASDVRVVALERMTATFGLTDLGVVHLVIYLSVTRDARERLAHTVAQTLGSVGLAPDEVRVGVSTLSVDLTVRLDDPIEPLITALELWRIRLGTASVPDSLPPDSPSALATALIFGVETSRGDRVDPAWLSAAPIDVLVAGGGDPAVASSQIDRLQARVAAAVALPSTAVSRHDHPQPTRSRPQEERRWATIPSLGSSVVRWYRFLAPPASGDEFLTRSIANVAFGGVHRSPLVQEIRLRGLSYNPTAFLSRHDGGDALVIDVTTSRGSETRCDDAIRDIVTDFVAVELSDEAVRTAIGYLVGRTLVDADSLNGVLAGRLAYLDGADISTSLELRDLADRLGALDYDAVRRTAVDLYVPEGFGALVLSPDADPKAWDPL